MILWYDDLKLTLRIESFRKCFPKIALGKHQHAATCGILSHLRRAHKTTERNWRAIVHNESQRGTMRHQEAKRVKSDC
jgi:hypothetical protein